jgi:type IV pilus assembly protein PilY1
VGTDGIDFWVYFGTGRFFDPDDKTDDGSNATQSFYGLREPVKDSSVDPDDCGDLTWATIANSLATGDAAFPYEITTSGIFPRDRGQLGLIQTDQINVLSTNLLNEEDTLTCKNGTLDCLPITVKSVADGGLGGTRSFMDLIDTISGTSFRCGTGTMGTDGWKRDFTEPRERNLGQASLLAGLVSYTSYRPYTDPCLSEGIGYLYGAYFLTGTPWVEDVFGIVDAESEPRVENPERMALGKGLSTTPNIHVGQEEGGKAFIQTSVGKIVEIPQPKLPNKNVKSGRIKWRDIED